jgi:hypothetical protein
MNIVHKIENAPIEVFTEENCKSPYLKYINTQFTDFEVITVEKFKIKGLMGLIA